MTLASCWVWIFIPVDGDEAIKDPAEVEGIETGELALFIGCCAKVFEAEIS